MLSPAYLSSCADDILKLYNDLNDAIIRDIVRRLVNLDFDISQTAVWQMEKLQEVGGLVYEDALREISKMTGKSEKELKQLFEDAGTESMSFDNDVYKKAGLTPLPLSQSPAMLQILTAGYRKCKGELKNLTLTTANMSQSLFINAVNSAYMQVASGAFSQNTAIANAIETIGESGAWILYPSGHRDRVDVAVRRAVQTGIGQTCGQLQIQQLDDMMWDVVDVTAHMGARLEHARWQGGRFSYKGRNKNYPDFETTTGYGTVEGLLGANCRHNFYPAIDGTPRMYSQEQIDEWNNHKVTYHGVEYSDREALDIQRAKERGIRATKRELTALDEGMKAAKDEVLKKELSEEFGRKSLKLRKQEAALNEFIEQTGFKKDYSRSQVKEFNRSMAGKVKAATKKELQKREQSGIMKTGGKITEKNFLKAGEYERQAARYYKECLLNNDDAVAIATHTEFSINDVLKIKRHMMSDDIKFKDGSVKPFDPDIDQALAWKRLITGTNIKETDILLLRHELEELTVMRQKNIFFEDAHAIANKSYNWEEAILEFVDEDELY